MTSTSGISGIDHMNLLTTPERLATIGRFYADVLGLRIGHRPGSGVEGTWLYIGDHPALHLSAKVPEAHASAAASAAAPGFDHVAFRAAGVAEFRRRLSEHGVPYRELKRPQGYQILLTDPDGTRLELNFSASEADGPPPAHF